MQAIYQEKQLHEGVISKLRTTTNTSSVYKYFLRMMDHMKMAKI